MIRTIVLAIACLSALWLAASSTAGEKLDLDTLREQRQEEIERYFVRELTQKRLSAAGDLIEQERYAKARKGLEKMKWRRLNPYERVLAYRLLAQTAVGQEDWALAIGYFEKVVEQGALPIDDEASVRFNIAQLHAAIEQWDEVEQTLNEWFPYVEEPNGVSYYLLAIARYRLDRHEDALIPALRAIELSDKPRESWLQLVSALYLLMEDFDSPVPILEQLVTHFPKKQYWLQLSLIYGVRGNYEQALQVQQLAYAQGLLTEDEELRRLARSYLFHDLPYPAARVLERGLEQGRIEPEADVLELLGNAWISAREYDKSVEPLQRAAEMADDGRLYLRLGQVRVQRESWKEATTLIQKALDKGGLDDVGKAHLLLGISYYSDERHESARTSFRLARKHESTRADAKAWLEHIARQSNES